MTCGYGGLAGLKGLLYSHPLVGGCEPQPSSSDFLAKTPICCWNQMLSSPNLNPHSRLVKNRESHCLVGSTVQPQAVGGNSVKLTFLLVGPAAT